MGGRPAGSPRKDEPVEELRANGVEIARPVSAEGFGLMTALRIPGGGEIGLYEPRHPTPPRVSR